MRVWQVSFIVGDVVGKADPESLVYRSVDGHDVVADVYLSGRAEAARPVILWLHGGGMIWGSRRHLPRWQLDRYLAVGYAVVAADYRLAPEVSVDAVVDDVVQAYRWVIGDGADRFGFDRDRVAVVGHSAGAYLALSIAGWVDHRPAAVVSFYGYATLGGEWSRTPSEYYREMVDLDEQAVLAIVGRHVTSDDNALTFGGRLGYYLWCRQQGTWLAAVCGRGRESDPEWLGSFEPVRHVTRDHPPTLLLHGDVDNDVPIERAFELVDAFKAHTVDHEVIRHKDWEHLFDLNMRDLSSPPSDPSATAAVGEVIRFLRTRLGDAAANR